MITFTPRQFQMEQAGFKGNLQKFFKGAQTAWNNFLKTCSQCSSTVFWHRCWSQNEKPSS